MAPLVLIGFITLCVIAMLFTVAFIQVLFGEIGFEGRPGAFSLGFGFIAACLWGLVWVFTPFTITFSTAMI